MERISSEEIAKAIKGKVNYQKDFVIDFISTNSRDIKENTLFIALKGDKFDGHNFIENVIESGCTLVITERVIEGVNYILVEDTKKALMDLAKYYRSKFNIPFIAVTGSVGKTTTKDAIHTILSEKYNCLKTEGNFNNEIGVPKTIFNLNYKTEIAVIEMGMNSFGEIHNLSQIVNPDICIITKIGLGHTEKLKDKEGVLRAKLEIIDYMKKDGYLILNFDDEMLFSYKNPNINILGIGENTQSNFKVNNIIEKGLDGLEFSYEYNNEVLKVKSSLLGKSLVTNLSFAILMGKIFNLSHEEITRGIVKILPPKNRMEPIKSKNYYIISDCYNANPTSMLSSIYFLKTCKNKKIAILGDMLELGNEENQLHGEIGKYLQNSSIDVLVCFGSLSKNIFANSSIEEKYFCTTKEEIIDILKEINLNNSVILVKGSRGMKLEAIVDYLKEW